MVKGLDVSPDIGRLVRALRGKDQGEIAVIIHSVDERFVLIADGHKRKFDHPKRKNIQHLELLPFISSEVADSMAEAGRVTNAKLRFAIRKYTERKGE